MNKLIVVPFVLMAFAGTAFLPVPAMAQMQSFEDIYKGAQSLVDEAKHPDPTKTEELLRAGEFRGYIAGLLDANRFLAKTGDERFAACADIEDRKQIAFDVAVTIIDRPLSTYPSKLHVLTLGLALQLVCIDAVKAQEKAALK